MNEGQPRSVGERASASASSPPESEKVSSPSAALPDVRALIAQARRLLSERWIELERAGTYGIVHRLADALEAALRSREGERAEPADAHECDYSRTKCDASGAFVCLHDDDPRCPDHDSRPAQPEEAAQRADFRAVTLLEAIADEANDPMLMAADAVTVLDVWRKEAREILAAQRATPSAPTPNDEKRAALADPSGTQERND